jgi:co-chaperonin GroES (HSP10)
MATLRALHDGIVFQFEEKVTKSKKGTFEEETEWGFKLNNDFDESARNARWGIIVSVGPDIIDEGLVPGARIFIEALAWTNGVEIGDETYWKTDESKVLAIDTSV